VIEQIRSGSLDIAYIDADRTLKGISIDLIRSYPKVAPAASSEGRLFADHGAA
jgi:hypothetical protein